MVSREEKGGSSKAYYSVFDGSFRTRVNEDHPEAVKRINKNGKQVFEREVRALFGLIKDVHFESSEYGEKIVLELEENEDGKTPVLSFGVESKDGRDIMRKLPSIDFTKEIRIAAYKFTPQGSDEQMAGISIHQQDANDQFNVKVPNFFFDDIKKEYKHGFPTIDWDNATDAKKKIYKVERDEFLKEYIKNNVIPKMGNPAPAKDSMDYPENTLDEVPF